MQRVVTKLFVMICFVMVSPWVAHAAEGRLTLSLPIGCELGVTCWIPNYVDLKPGKGVVDYTCGDATYDAPPGDQHKGTDFAVRDMAAVRNGVPVFAAAAGKVVGVRDGMADVGGTVSNWECGNGLRIDHDNGLTTQYCHMRRDSVLPKIGDRVERGQQLGLVGLSGQTAFPHLHFQVERDKDIIDPFAGLDRKKQCGVGEKTLWDTQTLAQVPYQPTAIYNAGFAPQKPDLKLIRDGQYHDRLFDATAVAMVVWAELFRVRAGDEIVIEITDPAGAHIHKQRIEIKAKKARYYAFSGLRLKALKWRSGTYRGKVTLIRKTENFSVIRQVEVR